MSATLTVNLDPDVLQLAQQEARSRHATLPEVVAQQAQGKRRKNSGCLWQKK